MKKEYQKPGIYIECFTMSESVAQNCNTDIQEATPVTYREYFGAGENEYIDIILIGEESACDYVYTSGSKYIESCYNNLEQILGVLINS